MANKIIVEFGAETAEFRSAISDGVKSGLSQFLGFSNGIKSIFAGLGAYFGASSLIQFGRSVFALGGHLRDMALNIGINVEKLQVLLKVARENGVEQDVLGRALFKTNMAAIQAAQGNKEHAQSFIDLGINVKQFLALPAELKMQELGRAYASAADKNKALNAITQIFGERIGPQLMTTLKELSERGFPALEREARKAGDVMSANTIAALHKAEEAIAEFKNRITVSVGNIIVNFRTEEGMKLLLYRFLEVAGRFGGKIADAIFQATDLVGAVLKGSFIAAAKGLQDGLISAVEKVLPIINRILKYGTFGQIQIDTKSLDKLKSDGEGFADSINRAVSQLKDTNFAGQFGDYWKNLADQQQLLVDQIDKIDLGKPAKQLTDAGKDLQASAEATAGAITDAAKKVKEILVPQTATVDSGAMKLIGGMRRYFNPLDQMRYESELTDSAKRQNQEEIDTLKKQIAQFKASGDTAGSYEIPALQERIKALEKRSAHIRDYVFNPNYSDAAGQGIFSSQVATIGDPLKLQHKQTDVLTKVASGVQDLNDRLRVAGLTKNPQTVTNNG